MNEALARLEPAAQTVCNARDVHVAVPGSIPDSSRDLRDFKRRTRDQLFAIRGLRMLGVGLCCSATPEARCLSVFLDPCGTPVDQVVRRIATRNLPLTSHAKPC
jgi:hypothetical protein